jgi:hypothetical protein
MWWFLKIALIQDAGILSALKANAKKEGVHVQKWDFNGKQKAPLLSGAFSKA